MSFNFPQTLRSVSLLGVNWPFEFEDLPTDGVLLVCVEGHTPQLFLDHTGYRHNYTWAVPMSLGAASGTFSWYTQNLGDDCVNLPEHQFMQMLRIQLLYVSDGAVVTPPPCPAGKRCIAEFRLV